VLVERSDQLATLRGVLAEAVGGTGRLVFLGGEAGVGKTALVEQVAATASGARVRRGTCDNVTTAAPLGALIDAVPELADVVADSAAVSRLALFGKVRATLATSPTLLVVEDLHWADEATLDMVRFIGRRLADLPLMIIATFRDDEVSAHHRLATVIGDLAAEPGVRRLTLAPLSREAVRELAAGSATDVDELYRRTGGNPFYVTEVLGTGLEVVPVTVRDAVLARVSRLGAGARDALAAAAVLGNRGELDLVAAVAGQPVQVLDECVAGGALVSRPDGTVAFRHELARLAVEQTIAPAASAQLHRAALRELTARDPGDDRALAHHAAGCGDAVALLHHATRAAARSSRLGAHREAAALYRLALRASGQPPETRADLYRALSYECYLTDQLEEALATQRQAMEVCELAGDEAGVGASLRWQSRLSWFVGRNSDARRYAVRAIDYLEPYGEGHELAMAYSNLAQLEMLESRATESLGWGERALTLARRIDDTEVVIHALNNLGTTLFNIGETAQGRLRLDESLELALAHDAQEHVARAYTNLGSGMALQRRFGDAVPILTTGIAYCEDRDLDSWTRYMGGWQASSLAEQGRYDDAVDLATRILGHPHLSPVSGIQAAVAFAKVTAQRGGDPGDVLDQAWESATRTGEAQRLVPVAAARAEFAWLSGRVREIPAAVGPAWDAAAAAGDPWGCGELSWWLRLAGVDPAGDAALAEPFAAMIAGDFAAAGATWRDLGARGWEAICLGLANDLDSARDGLRIADELGATALRTALLRTRHERGLPVPRAPRATSRSNPALLTARELEVLTLAAEGLSNAEIAQRLYLSDKTAGHHMSAVLRKLDEPGRARAVAKARRLGILPQT
jgi:DNA-binding CsgD family transcriptional regulator/tetratricopeptide (TPR) repeat protein